jgi:hypothetical protein
MAQTGYTPISLYYSPTSTHIPSAVNLVNGELALNTADGILYYKNANGVVQILASNAISNGVFTSLTDTSLSANSVVFAGTGGLLSSSGNLTWNGTTVTISGGLNVSGNNVVFGSNAAITVPIGTTGQEPVSPSTGMFRFNLSTSQFEGYNGSAWGQVGGGATGGGSDQIFVQNGQTVTTSYTIPSGKNASSAGTVTINTGVVVTVSTGSRWVIV